MKRLRSLLALLIVFGFVFGATMTSCGNKKAEDQTEQTDEHPSEDEHPSDEEHPSDDEHSGDEHPSGGEHPSSED
ncbi:hypothetical protein [Cecembia rubra]|nr:hypothetical protein [Cecembia rubra]